MTPKAIISGQAGKLGPDDNEETEENGDDATTGSSEEKALERERVDTFWSVFFLDRVISSGTGRPVTLRDEDIELRFPLQSESKLPNGWPAPFPPLIRIIHLYGRVTDLINGIEDNNIDEDTLKRLAAMESDLTGNCVFASSRYSDANGQRHIPTAVAETPFQRSQLPSLRESTRGDQLHSPSLCTLRPP